MDEFWLDAEDLQWIVYAAIAFNAGIKPKEDRNTEDIKEMWDRIERVGAKVGIKLNRDKL